ncbi:MAG: DUF459 domain-containing protein, partial [Actinomycetota bacterium]|nr:DUF459 domain-containing protein [Actinomycetota bacterium]
ASPASQPAPRTPTRAEPLRLFVGGDSMVGQFGPALSNLARRTGVIDAEFEYEFSSGLTRPDFVDWPARLREVGRSQDPEVLVLIFGGNDAQDLKSGDRLVPLGTPQWRAEYRQRVAQVMDQLGADGRRVFWVGMPIVRSATFEERVRMLNEIYRTEAAAHPSVTYVDSWDLFAGPDGRYAEYLPDETGALTDMRLNDGIHLTTAGAQRLAAQVMALVAAEWALPEGGSEPVRPG